MQTISQIVVHQVKAKNMSAFGECKTIWQNPLMYGVFLLLFGLIIVAVGDKLLGEKVISDIGSIMALAGVGFFFIKGLGLLRTSRGARSKNKAGKVDTTTELPPLLETLDQPSVTEFTTRNFDSVYAKRHEPNIPS